MRVVLLAMLLAVVAVVAAWMVRGRATGIVHAPEVTSIVRSEARAALDPHAQAPATRQPVASSNVSRDPDQPTTQADHSGDVLALLHENFAEQACLAGTSASAQPQKTAIHRWTDSKGVIHFSDQAPSGQVLEHRRIETAGLPPIVVRASGYDVNLPEDLVQNAIAAAQAIERVMRDTLGVHGDPGLVLDIEFIDSADTYAKRAGNPAMANSAGTYSPFKRTIHIRLQKQQEANLLILRHEITHALIHERIGRLPTAINEGIASYFEHLTVAGMGAQIRIAETGRSLVAARIAGDPEEALIDLLAHEGADFYATGQEQRYLRSYSLVALLMEQAPGQRALAEILGLQRRQPCQPVAAESVLQAKYPGGLKALAQDWAAWLRDPPRTVRSY